VDIKYENKYSKQSAHKKTTINWYNIFLVNLDFEVVFEMQEKTTKGEFPQACADLHIPREVGGEKIY